MSGCNCTGACKITGRCPNTGIDFYRLLRKKDNPLDILLDADKFKIAWNKVYETDGDDTEEHF